MRSCPLHPGQHIAMKSLMLFLALFLHYSHISAQTQIISTATGLITASRYDLAEHYLDSILKKNPKNIDARMMKGNVLLNYAWLNTTTNYFNIEKAESIFDTTAIDRSFFTPVIPEDTSRMVEKYWKDCLAIDSSRVDILKGLCNLYSISLRTSDLKQQLAAMRGYITQNDENAFLFSEYARNLKAR